MFHIIYKLLFQDGEFLSKELTGRINAFLKRAFRYGFATKILEVNSLLDSASKDLFCDMQRSYHSLFSILPVETPHDHKLRERGHNCLGVKIIFTRFHFLTNVCLV